MPGRFLLGVTFGGHMRFVGWLLVLLIGFFAGAALTTFNSDARGSFMVWASRLGLFHVQYQGSVPTAPGNVQTGIPTAPGNVQTGPGPSTGVQTGPGPSTGLTEGGNTGTPILTEGGLTGGQTKIPTAPGGGEVGLNKPEQGAVNNPAKPHATYTSEGGSTYSSEGNRAPQNDNPVGQFQAPNTNTVDVPANSFNNTPPAQK